MHGSTEISRELYKMPVDLTFNLHDFAILWTGNECMVQVLPCIPPFHFKLNSFLFDLAVVLNAVHGHAANAIKRQLQHKQMKREVCEAVLFPSQDKSCALDLRSNAPLDRVGFPVGLCKEMV